VSKKKKQKGYMRTSHWSDVTTGEVGSMVREAIKCGEQTIAEEARANGMAHQNAE
jgi:small acid-soluble spore protein F (minor alpha/beta-type SASP)